MGRALTPPPEKLNRGRFKTGNRRVSTHPGAARWLVALAARAMGPDIVVVTSLRRHEATPDQIETVAAPLSRSLPEAR